MDVTIEYRDEVAHPGDCDGSDLVRFLGAVEIKMKPDKIQRLHSSLHGTQYTAQYQTLLLHIVDV